VYSRVGTPTRTQWIARIGQGGSKSANLFDATIAIGAAPKTAHPVISADCSEAVVRDRLRNGRQLFVAKGLLPNRGSAQISVCSAIFNALATCAPAQMAATSAPRSVDDMASQRLLETLHPPDL
jgi:hypothetical protein